MLPKFWSLMTRWELLSYLKNPTTSIKTIENTSLKLAQYKVILELQLFCLQTYISEKKISHQSHMTRIL